MSSALILLSVLIFVVGFFIVAGVHDETLSDDYGIKIWLPTAIVISFCALFVFYLGCSLESCRELRLSLKHDEVLIYNYKCSDPPAEFKSALDAGFSVVYSEDYRNRHWPEGYVDYTKKYLVRDKATVSDEFNRLTK